MSPAPTPSPVDGGAAKVRVLVACEYSATVRDAFRARGFDAWSCDLLPSEGDPQWHLQRDVSSVVHWTRGGPWRNERSDWDLLIAHPPCTYLSRAGARWWKQPGRDAHANAAANFVFQLRDAPIQHIAIENPIGQLNQRWRYPDQTIQPWEFGHPFTKATCLWLKNLPPLMPTEIMAERTPYLPSNTGEGRRAGERFHAGTAQSTRDRNRTFAGIAAAMASQWGDFLLRDERIAA
jgi:site-specific DNA-cytosine methylase